MNSTPDGGCHDPVTSILKCGRDGQIGPTRVLGPNPALHSAQPCSPLWPRAAGDHGRWDGLRCRDPFWAAPRLPGPEAPGEEPSFCSCNNLLLVPEVQVALFWGTSYCANQLSVYESLMSDDQPVRERHTEQGLCGGNTHLYLPQLLGMEPICSLMRAHVSLNFFLSAVV